MGRELMRLLVLIVVLGNVLFNAFYSQLLDLPAINVISYRYETFFTPAGYAFSIWGVIYISLILYSITQLLPERKEIKVYDELAPYVIINNLLGSVWIYLFVSELFLMSLFVIITMLVTAFFMAKIASEGELRGEINLKVVFPFGILYGWLIAASVANLWIYLTAIQLDIAVNDYVYVLLGVTIAVWLTSIIAGLKIREYFNWLAFGWALVAVWIKHQSAYGKVALLPMILGTILVPWSFYLLYQRWKEEK